MDPRAAEYERRFPGTGVSEAQAIERMERLAHREVRGESTRSSRILVVPELPWLKEKADA